MRFLVDECTGPAVAQWLRDRGYEVFSVYEQARGITDEAIIEKAFAERWILITVDKDFGTKIYRDQHAHHGVVLLRLDNAMSSVKIRVLQRLLDKYSNQLPDRYVVVTEDRVRFAQSYTLL